MHDELIVVDAVVVGVIDNRAFRAQLSNGHGLVAYRRPGEYMQDLVPGQRVQLRVSLFDLSSGEIVAVMDGLHHEGT